MSPAAVERHRYFKAIERSHFHLLVGVAICRRHAGVIARNNCTKMQLQNVHFLPDNHNRVTHPTDYSDVVSINTELHNIRPQALIRECKRFPGFDDEFYKATVGALVSPEF